MSKHNHFTYHILYKTTCKITGRFYIGMHSTNDLADGYLGSGKFLKHSIQKHGKDNHVFECLESFKDRQTLAAKEKEIVTIDFIKSNRPLCMNLKHGGEGGKSPWTDEERTKMMSIFTTQEYKDKISKKSKEAWADPNVTKKRVSNIKKALNDPVIKAKRSKSMVEVHSNLSTEARANWNANIIKAHESIEVKNKISSANKLALSNPEVREKYKNAAKEFSNRPEEKERRKQKMQEKWKDPEYKAMMLAARKKK